MKVVAFDAKKFQRVKRTWNETDAREEKTTVFVSQLGIGVTVPEPEVFTENYVTVSQDLRRKFNIDYDTPFFSSACLNDNLGLFDAVDFTKCLLLKMQDHIESVHCSYVVLPTPTKTYVEEGGIRCPKVKVPATRFIDGLGSAFSYLTTLSYIWTYGKADFNNLEMHIDAFRSKHTKGWTIVKDKASTKIFYKGDECNPFISCADIIAFYLDNTLSKQKMRLLPDNVKNVFKPYKFSSTVHLFDSHNKHYCSRQTDQSINILSRLARPIVFLAIDKFAETNGKEFDGDQDKLTVNKSRKADVRQTEVYQAALKYAYQQNGCMKLFSVTEDKSIIKSGDVFVYVGPNSKKIGDILQDMVDIHVYSGLDVIKMIKK